MNQSNIRMGWLPNAQMIADGMPDAPKAKPPALLRRPATEFKGECFDARDMAHPAAKVVSAPVVTRTHIINVITGSSHDREEIEAVAQAGGRSADNPFTPLQSQPRKPARDGIAAYFGLELTEPAAPKTDAEGWIEWKGGECPVEDRARYEVRFRNGGVDTDDRSCTFHWEWLASIDDGDIVAYRVLP